MKEEIEEITFETAQELKLIPQQTKRYFGWQPFMSAYGVEKRDAEQEILFRHDRAMLKEEYQFVYWRGKKLKVI